MSMAQEIDWTSAVVDASLDLHGAIVALDRVGLQILLMTDSEGYLLGTITDGDIRRALLRGSPLTTAARDVMHLTPMVVGPDLGRTAVLTLMQVNKIRQLPIISPEGRVVGLHLWDQVLAVPAHDNTVVLMAGGFGKRMMPYTETRPKPMLEVAGKPLLQHALERARADGFTRFLITLHYLPQVIQAHFGDGSAFDVEIDYVHEDTPLGTAGALSLIKDRPSVPMIVANGDILTDVRFSDMLEFHRQHGATATMAVREHEYHNPFGVVQTDGVNITAFEEKPVWRTKINAGLYVLNPEALDLLTPNSHCNMPTLFERIQAKASRTIVYPMHETWMDVGNPQDLLNANRAFD
ncbi:MAG: nucleotidyltransferase family protein [Rhodobacteraceae bacterium]|nr:nucleotidyltransferase family protein [Paracoccaceae bacterium]MCF8515945.1 nucleotidyltransferase family protein [Paracoccaceae bacterium]MCF8520286.1 nucleotidyltransferase family protein [Paracoccaceae bacterium]